MAFCERIVRRTRRIGYIASVKFGEKLKLLISKSGLSQAKIAGRAGISPSVLSNYITRNSEPLAGAALRLARVVDVPVEWLVDDQQSYPPPPKSDATARSFTDDELMLEIACRHRELWVSFLDAFQRAISIDWDRAVKEARSARRDEPLPSYARQALTTLDAVTFKYEQASAEYDLHEFKVLHHPELPGGDRDLRDFEDAEAGFVLGKIENDPRVQRFYEAISDRPEWVDRANRPKMLSYRERHARAYNARAAVPQPK